MIPTRRFRSIFLTAGAVGLVTIASRVSLHAQEILQDVQTIIMEGKVAMPDGTPPPKTVGHRTGLQRLQRRCPWTHDRQKRPLHLDAEALRRTFSVTASCRRRLTGLTSTRVPLGRHEAG